MRPLILLLIATATLASHLLAEGPTNTATTIPDAGSTDARLPNTKTRFEKYMAKLAATPKPIDLVFDGDSITDGWQNGGLKVWQENWEGRRAFDFGVSGDMTQHLLWRLSQGQTDGLNPKLVALMIGTNNMYSNSAEEIAAGVKAVVEEYQKRAPEAVILLQGVFPRAQSPSDPVREKIKEVNQMISSLGDGKKVIYVDFGDKFLGADGTMSPEVMPDFLHPSAKGYEIWAEAIRPIVDKYCPTH